MKLNIKGLHIISHYYYGDKDKTLVLNLPIGNVYIFFNALKQVVNISYDHHTHFDNIEIGYRDTGIQVNDSELWRYFNMDE